MGKTTAQFILERLADDWGVRSPPVARRLIEFVMVRQSLRGKLAEFLTR